MKWVKVTHGTYKYVEDSDDRPAVTLSKKPIDGRSISTPYIPPWGKYEEGMKHPDSKHQDIYADKFIAERDFQVRTDPKAKRWEASRKADWEKEKPNWVKMKIKEDSV
jgi:hypothetical protein